MRKKIQVTDFCPEAKCKLSIVVTVEESPSLGCGHKLLTYYCPYADEHDCHTNGNTGRDCPLLKKV